ncbi:TauD/TfdA dioxygenase family protein [Caballeronia sp. 15715]|uniref:TauD/TfdA dioxygenase family protein n=1 Tax=Caballeronia sp. 15715 TaxID=3391030 RepID=UPI0039E57348
MSFDLKLSDAPLGHELQGVDLRDLDDATFGAIDSAYKKYGVIVIRDQELTPVEQIAFSSRFGKLDPFALDRFNMKEHPEIFIVSNIIEDGRPIGMEDAGRYWHSDMWYTAAPPRGSHLYAIEVPHNGREPLGDTYFASTAYAYRTLSQDMQDMVGSLQAIFSLPKYTEYVGHTAEKARDNVYLKEVITAQEKIKDTEIIHNLVRTHPITGEKCLYMVQGVIRQIIGMQQAESDELVEYLTQHVIRKEVVYRHRWRVGDLVMWDNYSAVHRATGDFKLPERRLMHRTTLGAPAPA